jgi:colicin import membrane protein
VSYAIPQNEPGGPVSVVLAFLVHLMLFSLLFFGLRWQSKNPDAVIVELWNQLPPLEQPAPKPEPVPEVKPEAKPALKLEPKLETKVEPKPQKPDIAVEREKKIAKKAPPKKEPPLKFDTTKRIQEQLAQEQQALRQSRERQEVLRQFAQPAPRPSPDAGYVDKIRSKIRSNIVVPLDIKGNPEAIFIVEQLPTGEIKFESVRLTKSSGVKAFDDAVERAILKSSPLPLPDRREQFVRELTLKFRPQDLK